MTNLPRAGSVSGVLWPGNAAAHPREAECCLSHCFHNFFLLQCCKLCKWARCGLGAGHDADHLMSMQGWWAAVSKPQLFRVAQSASYWCHPVESTTCQPSLLLQWGLQAKHSRNDTETCPAEEPGPYFPMFLFQA